MHRTISCCLLFLLSSVGCAEYYTCTADCKFCGTVQSASGGGCSEAEAYDAAKNKCPGDLVDPKYTSELTLAAFSGCYKEKASESLMPADILSAEFAQAGGRTLLRLVGGSRPVNEVLPTDACPTGNVQFTVKFVNNYNDCFEGGPTYFRCTYSTHSGEQSQTQSVAPGATSMLSITAYDGNQDEGADSALVDYSGSSDLDPNICASGSLGGENILQDGDTWTLTLNEDGSLTEEITSAASRARAPTKSTAARGPLQPIPDPRFSGR